MAIALVWGLNIFFSVAITFKVNASFFTSVIPHVLQLPSTSLPLPVQCIGHTYAEVYSFPCFAVISVFTSVSFLGVSLQEANRKRDKMIIEFFIVLCLVN
jgi:hypothetical protein